jgi:hypothetical protein
MTFENFVSAVDNLVREWAHDSVKARAVPRAELKKIFEDLREQVVYEVAVAMQEKRQFDNRHHKASLASNNKPEDKTKNGTHQ